MKYVVLVGDGMADYPLEELGGKTPLMVATTPHMDWIARHGDVGLVKTIPPGFSSAWPARPTIRSAWHFPRVNT